MRPQLTRRQLLEISGLGMGSLALACILDAETQRGSDLSVKATHFAPKAKAVIQLMQNGGPSQMDLFDPKPELKKRHGMRHSEKVEMFQPGSEANELMASPFEFHHHSSSGMELSEALTHTSSIVDEICLVRSMYTGHNNHTEALVMLQTGKIFRGRPTMGSWITCALGTENQSLPAYVVLRDPEGYNTSGALLWENGWMPALYRGTEFNTVGPPVENLQPAVPLPKGAQADNLAF